MEEWENIIGYEGLYQVSTISRVKSLGNSKSNYSKPKILKIGKRRQYGKIMLYKNGVGKEFAVHRLVAQAFLGLDIDNPKILCLHKKEDLDDRGMLDNSLSNLFLGTHKDNTQDMLAKGRHKPVGKGKFGKEHNTTNSIEQYTLEGNYIKTWNGGYEVQRALGFTPSNINRVCNGIRKTAHGFIWKYI